MKNSKTALITGITGQDGSYLARLLLSKGYKVHGIVRRSSTINTSRIDDIFNDITLHYGDMVDGTNLRRIFDTVVPHEIYNLAAQSHVKVSFETPEYTAMADALGPLKIFEAVLNSGAQKTVKIYQASTSEMYGNAPAPQNEKTPMHPVSPYGAAKLYAHNIAQCYRDAYGMHISCGILFNHESPLRGETFVTRKITRAIAEIVANRRTQFSLGNIHAKRDWGHAADYVESMLNMMQSPYGSDNFVVATGKSYSVKDFVDTAFNSIGRPISWGLDNNGLPVAKDRFNRQVVTTDPKYYRPNEINELRGDASYIKNELAWEPKISFNELVEEMVSSDIKRLQTKDK